MIGAILLGYARSPHKRTATEPGFVCIFVSNEDPTYVDVYFDDVTVTHTLSPVVEMDDYYPFGLTYNSYQRENATPNRYKFQGQEHVDDLDLTWNQFKWRMQDPTIGRFVSVDPLADTYVYNSPYAFAENRVIDGRELEGLEWVQANDNSWVYDETIPEGSRPQAAWTSTDDCGVQSLNIGGSCGTVATYQANENGMVELPSSGGEQTGAGSNGTYEIDGQTVYGYYNRNDIEGGVEDQWGTPTDVADMVNSIVEYNISNPNDLISIGDMRSPTNGQVSNTTTDLHHANDGAFDIRILGDQGTMPAGSTISSPGFSITKTQSFIDALGNNGFTRFLIGPAAVPNLCSPSGSISVLNGGNAHNNHYHVDKD